MRNIMTGCIAEFQPEVSTVPDALKTDAGTEQFDDTTVIVVDIAP
jgi:hypothetical protein